MAGSSFINPTKHGYPGYCKAIAYILFAASRLWILDNHSAFQQMEVFFMTAFRWAMIAGVSAIGAGVIVAFLRESLSLEA